jgi:hypothetical protein
MEDSYLLLNCAPSALRAGRLPGRADFFQSPQIANQVLSGQHAFNVAVRHNRQLVNPIPVHFLQSRPQLCIRLDAYDLISRYHNLRRRGQPPIIPPYLLNEMQVQQASHFTIVLDGQGSPSLPQHMIVHHLLQSGVGRNGCVAAAHGIGYFAAVELSFGFELLGLARGCTHQEPANESNPQPIDLIFLKDLPHPDD